MPWQRIAEGIARQGAAVLATLVEVKGSAPREAGTHMVITPDARISGTIGGGSLEYVMAQRAADMLAEGMARGELHRQALGPDLGQCCGGQALLRLELFNAADLDWVEPLAAAQRVDGLVRTTAMEDGQGRLVRRISKETAGEGAGFAETFGISWTPVQIFGAGHVGRALVLALAPLPFAVEWIDSRSDAFPSHVPANVTSRQLADPVEAVGKTREGALAVVMTHSHPLDLALVAAALPDPRYGYVGLIGSDTKRARFESQLKSAGMTDATIVRLVCPIGGRRLADKSPPVIAAAVALELLEARERGLAAAQTLPR